MQTYSSRLMFFRQEIIDLVKSFITVALAFTIAQQGLSLAAIFFTTFVISLATAGLGFILHELAHKVMAHRYGCSSIYIASTPMLMMSLLLSLFGLVFAAPGAVYITGSLTKKEYGKVSAAGPLANILLGIAFLGIILARPGATIKMIALVGLSINSWIALFNMLPIGNFDGAKIWRWSKPAYFAMITISAGLMMASMAV